MRYVLLITMIVCWAALNAVEQAAAQTFKIHKDLVFSEPKQKMTLDLYVPTEVATKARPCIIVIQGGGFKAQNGHKFRPYAEYFAANNYVAALISYRGLQNDTYKETVADVKSSVRYLRSISKEYNIDALRIGAMGRSAGGTLAVLLGLSAEVQELEGAGGHGQFSSRIQAAAGIAGVYDFIARYTNEEQRALQPRIEEKIKSNGKWIGSAFSADNKGWQRVSAINHIDKSDPPILLLHCKNDPIVPWQQSDDVHQALQQAGVKSELVITERGGHGGPGNSKELMLAFFNKAFSVAE